LAETIYYIKEVAIYKTLKHACEKFFIYNIC
jgi:hypothetical protein